MKSISKTALLLVWTVVAPLQLLGGWASATGGSGGPGTVPSFYLQVDNQGVNSPYGFEFIDVYDGGSFVQRIGHPNGGYHPNYTSFTWTDPRGSSFTGTHNYMFGFTGWSPWTSHYNVATAYASFTITAPASGPDWTSTSGPSSATANQSVSYTFTAHDPDGDITQMEVAWRTPSGAVYAIYPWFSVGPAGQPSVSRTITFNQGAGQYQVWVNARDSGGRTRDPWAQGISSERLTVNVGAGNTPPAVSISANTSSIIAGQSVTFTVTGSDADGNLDGLNLDMTSPASGYFKVDSGPYTFTGSPPNNGSMSFSARSYQSQTCTITFPTAGTYYLVGAARDPSGWRYSNAQQITVQPGTNGIRWDALNLPSTGIPGSTITFSATVTNTGSTTWTNDYYLELADQNGNHLYYPSIATTSPTGSKTVTFSLTLPSSPGTYTYYFRGMQYGVQYFGTTQMRQIVVNTPPFTQSVTTSASAAPESTIIAGQQVTFTGTATDADGNLKSIHFYVAGPTMPPWNYQGTAQVSGASATGSYTWTTPTTVGSYSVHIRAQDVYNEYDNNTVGVMTSFNVRLAQDPVSGRASTDPVTIALGSTFTPQPGVEFKGGSGTGAWQFVVSGYSNWPGRNSSGAVVNAAELAGAGTWLGEGGPRSTSFTPSAGGEYWYWIRRYGDGTYATSNVAGPFKLIVVANSVPSFTQHPTSQNVNLGGSVTFSASAAGTPAPALQWRKDGVAISGATAASYTISNVQATHAGTYTCIATNSSGTATSNGAVLTVNTPPTITSHPVNQTVGTGQPVSFSVSAAGASPLSYQWRKNGSAISGATSATYTLPNTQAGDAGTYTCVVTNPYGSATSNGATLTVSGPVFIDLQIHRP